MKKLLVVLAAALATAAIAVTPAFAGSDTWTGQGLPASGECPNGAHWILSPGNGISAATLTVDGVNYTMNKNGPVAGNGSLEASTLGAVDADTDASATWAGADGATLKVSHCLGSTTTTTTTTSGPSTTTAGPSTTTAGPSTTTAGPSTTTEGPSTTTEGPSTSTAGPTTSTTGSGGVSGGGTTGGTTGGTAPTGGNLPFTGLPIWIPLLAAAALLASGVVLMRRKRTDLS
jgi:hypothetical protein